MTEQEALCPTCTNQQCLTIRRIFSHRTKITICTGYRKGDPSTGLTSQSKDKAVPILIRGLGHWREGF